MNTNVPINVPAWGLILFPILTITVMGVIVLVINLANGQEKNIYKIEKRTTLTSWIQKKDLLYWLLIICLGAISLITFRYKDATEVISHWGFAGTIVSIILAVVAIGFTLFQTLSSNLSSEKIAVSADKIEQATLNLDSKTLQQSSKVMIEAADFLKEKMTYFEDKLNSINDAQTAISEIAATGFGGYKSTSEKIEKNGYIIDFNKFFNEVNPDLPYYPQVFVYLYLKGISKGLDLYGEYNKSFPSELTKFDINKRGYTEEYRLAANTGSLGATFSFLDNLRIDKMFMQLPIQEQETLLEKFTELLEQIHIDFINEFIENSPN